MQNPATLTQEEELTPEEITPFLLGFAEMLAELIIDEPVKEAA